MGGYELIGKELHYTGDGWSFVTLTDEQIKQFKEGTLDKINLNWEKAKI